MLEPDSTSRVVPTQAAAPTGDLGPHALQILTTEHWSLLAARSLVYTEAMSRTSIYVAALTGSVVALALVAQATDFGTGFVAFALVLLPVVYFLGLVTIVRLSQVNREDALWVQGMNRIRHAYLELAPELQPYFVTSRYDDDDGILLTSVAMGRRPPPTQAFVAAPGVVAVVDSVVAGAVAGIAGIGLGLGTGGALALGAVLFLLSMAFFAVFAKRSIETHRRELEPLFPTPPGGDVTQPG
ncbi:MAG: hypothetical protein ACRDPZ_07270 [Gaiellaceae bacterium]